MAGITFQVVDNVTSQPVEGVLCYDILGEQYTDSEGYTSFVRDDYVDTYWNFEKDGYVSIAEYWARTASYGLTFIIHMEPVSTPKPVIPAVLAVATVGLVLIALFVKR